MSKLTLAGDFQFIGYKKEGSVNMADLGIDTIDGAVDAALRLAPEYLPVMGCWVLCLWHDNGTVECVGELHGRSLEGQKKILYRGFDKGKEEIE